MARRDNDGGSTELSLPRLWKLRVLFFAWFPIPDLTHEFDRRFRTTKTYRLFLKYVRGVRFTNTIFFVRAYLGVVAGAVDLGFTSSVCKYVGMAPSDVTTISGWILPTPSLAGIVWALFQGWSTGLLLLGILIQLAKFAQFKKSSLESEA